MIGRASLLVTVAAVVAAVTTTSLPAPSQTLTAPVTVRVATTSEDQTTALLYGVHAGLFAKAGLNIEIIPMNSGGAVSAALIGNAADIGKSSLMGLINAHVHGVPFTLIAPGGMFYKEKPDGGLLVAKTSPLRTAKDFAGKSISVPALGGINSIAVQAWLDQNGGDPKAVHFLEIPPGADVAALEQGRVDGATLFNPSYQSALSSGRTRVAANLFAAIGSRFLETCWFTTTSYVESHRDVVERFETVLQQASLYANAHPGETLDLVASFSHVPVETLSNMQRAVFPRILEERDIQPVVDAAVKYDVVPKGFPAKEMISDAALKN